MAPKLKSPTVESLFAEKPGWARSSIETAVPEKGLGEVVGDVLGAWVEVSRVQLENQRALLSTAKRSKRDAGHLSLREAAARLGVGRDVTLKELIARGEIETITVQGKIRVPVSEVERLVGPGGGFDTNSPAPRKKGKGAKESKKSKAVSGAPGKAIKGLKF